MNKNKPFYQSRKLWVALFGSLVYVATLKFFGAEAAEAVKDIIITLVAGIAVEDLGKSGLRPILDTLPALLNRLPGTLSKGLPSDGESGA